MKFAIDVIGLDRDDEVIRLWRQLVPYRAAGVSLRLASVSELLSGRIAACDVRLGDKLAITAP